MHEHTLLRLVVQPHAQSIPLQLKEPTEDMLAELHSLSQAAELKLPHRLWTEPLQWFQLLLL